MRANAGGNPDYSKLLPTYNIVVPAEFEDGVGWVSIDRVAWMFVRANNTATGMFGLDHGYMESAPVGYFILQTHFRYLVPLSAGDRVSVHSRLIRRSLKRFHLMHFMVKSTVGDLAATYEVVSAHVDLRVRQMAPLPGAMAEKFDRLLLEHETLGWDPPLCDSMRP